MGWTCGTYGTDIEFWYENLKLKRRLENLGVDGLKNWTPTWKKMRGYGLDSSGTENGPVAVHCEQGKENKGSIKRRIPW